MTCARLQLQRTKRGAFCVCVFFRIEDWQAKRQTKLKLICAWLQLQTTRRGVFSQDRRQTNKKDPKNADDLCMTATTTTTTRGAVVLFWIVLFRQTYKTTHKYRWSVCDCNYKQQEEVCFLRIEDRQTKIKMIIAWLQLQTTTSGVFSQNRRQTNKNKDDYCMTATTNNNKRCVFSG